MNLSVVEENIKNFLNIELKWHEAPEPPVRLENYQGFNVDRYSRCNGKGRCFRTKDGKCFQKTSTGIIKIKGYSCTCQLIKCNWCGEGRPEWSICSFDLICVDCHYIKYSK